MPVAQGMIRKLKSGYRLYSRKTDPKTGKRRNLGTFDSREARKHERECNISSATERGVASTTLPVGRAFLRTPPPPAHRLLSPAFPTTTFIMLDVRIDRRPRQCAGLERP